MRSDAITSGAVQARRLAEHIESLTRRSIKRTRNRTMTESSIFDAGHRQHPKPNTKNKPGAGRGTLAFNPLHPSMELPPEQLIRLLGMESKKTRQNMKMRRSSRQQKSVRAIDGQKIQHSPDQKNARCATDEQKPHASHDPKKSHRVADKQITHRSTRQERPKPQQVAHPSHPMEYERNQPAVFDKLSSGWLLPALVIGLVAGVVVSGSLFWYQSSPAAKQKTPAPVVSSEPQNRRIPKQQVKSQAAKRKTAPAKTAPANTARTDNDAKWQAAIKAEQNRLRSTAEQRLNEQLTKVKVSRELADLQTPPANDHPPATAATLPAAAEPAFDQAAVSEPVPARAESPPTQEAPVEIPEPETLPVVTADEAVGPDRNGGMFEESTGLVDSLEQDTVSDVAATIEQDSMSDIAPSPEVNATTAFTHSNERDTVSDVKPASGQELEAGQSTRGASDESASSAPGDSALF
jgi:hypothetical protein